MTWTIKKSEDRVALRLAECASIVIKDLTTELNLENMPLTTAYRVDAAHAYVDISNATSLLDTTANESERSHRRYLRFLEVYERVAHQVFGVTDAVKVDFQNQRLHFVVYRPFDSESKRIATAVTVANLLRQVIQQVNELHNELPDARIVAGVESGICLAVRNGARGDREPLFIGNAANHAAKHLASGEGIYLGPVARKCLGADWAVTNTKKSPLSESDLKTLAAKAGLTLTTETLVAEWKQALANTPQSDFNFTRPMPPLSDIPLDELTPRNSRRIDAVSLRADIDGFTQFVANAVASRSGQELAIRGLHAIRSELRDVTKDFDGIKIRYIGDCVESLFAEGAGVTKTMDTMVTAISAAAAMRDAFDAVLRAEPGLVALGLQIGLEYGPVSVTRLGVRGSRDECSAGLAVQEAEAVQGLCGPRDTGLGATAYKHAPAVLADLFDTKKQAAKLTVNAVGYALAKDPAAAAVAKINVPTPPTTLPRAHMGKLP